MANPLFAAMNGAQPNLIGLLNQFKANPMQYLMQRKLNAPQSMMNDPGAIMEHLLKTGQVNQSQVNRAYQMANQLRR